MKSTDIERPSGGESGSCQEGGRIWLRVFRLRYFRKWAFEALPGVMVVSGLVGLATSFMWGGDMGVFFSGALLAGLVGLLMIAGICWVRGSRWSALARKVDADFATKDRLLLLHSGAPGDDELLNAARTEAVTYFNAHAGGMLPVGRWRVQHWLPALAVFLGAWGIAALPSVVFSRQPPEPSIEPWVAQVTERLEATVPTDSPESKAVFEQVLKQWQSELADRGESDAQREALRLASLLQNAAATRQSESGEAKNSLSEDAWQALAESANQDALREALERGDFDRAREMIEAMTAQQVQEWMEQAAASASNSAASNELADQAGGAGGAESLARMAQNEASSRQMSQAMSEWMDRLESMQQGMMSSAGGEQSEPSSDGSGSFAMQAPGQGDSDAEARLQQGGAAGDNDPGSPGTEGGGEGGQGEAAEGFLADSDLLKLESLLAEGESLERLLVSPSGPEGESGLALRDLLPVPGSPEESGELEGVPAGRRETVRRYFESLRGGARP